MKMLGGNKGTIFYTFIGIMIIILVLVIALHIMRSTYTPEKPDELERQKFIDAIKSVHAEMQTASRYAEYPAIWKAGRNISPSGINVYLELSDGRNRMKQDLIKDYTKNLNTYLKSISINSTSGQMTLMSSGVPVTMTEIQEEDVSVNETSTGLIFTIKTRMNSSGKNYRYENEETITSEVPVRLFDMYDKAKIFHQKYQENEAWALTIALYTRAYANAYNPEYTGSFLREGHTAYDPLQQLLSGSPAALKNFSINDIDDVGSIPLSTWLSEWQMLSEPSFLPPSFDFEQNLAGNSKIISDIKKNYDIEGAADCTDQVCSEWNDPSVIRAKAADLTAKLKKLNALSSQIKAYNPSEKMYCDDFRTQTIKIIEDVKTDLEFETSREIIGDAGNMSIGTNLTEKINQNYDTVKRLENLTGNLDSAKARASVIFNSNCTLPSDMDCSCAKGPERCDSDNYCLECDDPSCNKIACITPKSKDFTCDSQGTGSRRSEEVFCSLETCRESCDSEGCSSECETEEVTKTVKIDECNCGCHPTRTIINAVEINLDAIRQYIEDNKASLKRQIEELNNRAKTLEEASATLNEIEDLEDHSTGMRYDVVSEINYDQVKYYPVLKTGSCYYNTSYLQKDNGTCGNRDESTLIYTAQISAAVICCSLTGACCTTVEYATKWFPAIYNIEGTYTINETIVDDKNRIIPMNLFSNGTDIYGLNETPKLYTHAAAEFIVYQNRKITVTPKTGGIVLVYLYLPQMKPNPVQKVLDSMNDGSCTGKTC